MNKYDKNLRNTYFQNNEKNTCVVDWGMVFADTPTARLIVSEEFCYYINQKQVCRLDIATAINRAEFVYSIGKVEHADASIYQVALQQVNQGEKHENDQANTG